MSAQSVEGFLARLYTDRALRDRFFHDPVAVATQAGLDGGEAAAVANLDRVGLELAADSYERKRSAHQRPRPTWLRLLRRLMSP